MASSNLAVRSLIVSWNVARGVFDFVRETVYACETVVHGIVAFTAMSCNAVQTLHLLLERWQSQLYLLYVEKYDYLLLHVESIRRSDLSNRPQFVSARLPA
jgi:hypothetical protein